MLRCDEISLKKYKDDTWSIAYVKNNRYDLFYNNYIAMCDWKAHFCQEDYTHS